MAIVSEQVVRNAVLPSHIVATDTWRPLPHGQLLDIVDDALKVAGLEIARDDKGNSLRQFTLVDKGAKMFATLPLTSRITDEVGLMLGLANSWNRTLAARIGFGSRVFVCSNGAFFAEKVLGRKHTTNILNDLPRLIAAALEQTKTYADQQRGFFERLKEIEMSEKDVNDFVVRSALDHDAITVGEIGDVVAEYRKPRFAEFESRTAWSLHNAYTEVGKRIQQKNGNLHSERMVRLSGLFADSFAGDLKLSATRINAEPADASAN
jgi:hypothetical protein